jgi:hypothetical protein
MNTTQKSLYTRIGLGCAAASLALAACGGVNVSIATPTPANPAAQSAAPTATVAATATALQPTNEPESTPTRAPAATPTSAPEPPAKPVPTASAIGAGTVYAVGNTGRISVMRDGAWSDAVQLDVFSGCLEADFAINDKAALVRCGGAMFAEKDGAWGETFTNAFGPKAVDSKDTVWNLERDAIKAMRADGTLDEYKPDLIQADHFPDGVIYVDANDHVWVGGFAENTDSVAVASFDGKRWRAYLRKDFAGKDGAVPEYLSPEALFQTSKGEVWALTSNGVFQLNDGKFELLIDANTPGKLISDFTTIEFTRVIEAPDGAFWFTSNYGLFRYAGGKFKLYDRRNKLPSHKIYDVKIDTANRAWVATDFGLAVQESAGSDTFQVAVPSTSALPEAVLVGLHVSGAPALPAAQESEKTGSISGRITLDGQPMADTEIQLCAGDYDPTSRNTGDTPCAINFWSAIAKADADGNFKFDAVPLGSYKYAIRKPGEKWSAIILFSEDVSLFEADKDVVFDMKFKSN